MTHPTVLHLIDDTTPGGVMRVVDHILNTPLLRGQAQHQVAQVSKAALVAPKITADIIVSHTTISWRSLPMLISLRAKHPKAKLIHVEHSYTKRFTALNVPKRERFFTLLRTAYALFDHVVAVSRPQGSWLVTRGLVAQEKLRVIRSAVDLATFEALDAPTGQPRVVGAVGRLHKQKGFDVLIQAFARLPDPDARLKIFGAGPERAALQALAAKDPRVSLEGHVDDPTQAMAAIDVLCVPSRWEAFGLVAQEGLAAKRRVFVAPVDGLQDQVSQGALPVDGPTVNDWVKALQQGLEGQTPRPKVALSMTRETFQFAWLGLIEEALSDAIEKAA